MQTMLITLKRTWKIRKIKFDLTNYEDKSIYLLHLQVFDVILALMDMIVVDLSRGLSDGGDCACFLFRYNDSVFPTTMLSSHPTNFRGISDQLPLCYLLTLKTMLYVSWTFSIDENSATVFKCLQ